MAMDVSGRTVIVTGAAGGIGSAVCRRLARDGARIWAVDLRQDAVDALLAELPGKGHSGSTTNLADLTEQRDLIDAVGAAEPELVGLVHTAAVLRRRTSIDDVTEDDWDYQIDTNLKATFFLDRSVAGLLIAQGRGGSIVNFSSQGWWTGGFGGSVVYAASKGGIVSMSRGLARSLAPHNIRVNIVAPGFVDTEMMRVGLTDDQLQASIDQVPLGRLATPDEVADAATFLVGPDSRYVTGATLNVTGGQLMY